MQEKLRLFVISLGVFAAVIGTIGIYSLLSEDEPAALRLFEAIYLSLAFFTFSYPDYLIISLGVDSSLENRGWMIQTARFLAPLVTVTTAISLFSAFLERRIKRLRVRLFYTRHAVIYGFNLRSKLICEDLLAKRKRQILILDPNLTEKDIAWAKSKGIITFRVYGADHSAPKLCKAEKAELLFAVSDDDALNMKILVRAYQRNYETYYAMSDEARKREAEKNPTHCYVHFSDSNFKQLKFGGQFSSLDNYFNLQIFNIFDQTAKRVAKEIYREFAEPILSGKTFEVSVFGIERMGEAIIEQLIRLSFFKSGTRIMIKAYDVDDSNWLKLAERFPILEVDRRFYDKANAARLEELKQAVSFPVVRFQKRSLSSAALTHGSAIDEATDDSACRAAIISFKDATQNLALADCLLQQQRAPFSKIYIRSDEPESEIRKFVRSEIERKKFCNFPNQDEVCKVDSLSEDSVEKLAKAIHDNYIEKTPHNGAENPSNTDWKSLDESFREANRHAAAHIEIKCLLIGIQDLHLNDKARCRRISQIVRERVTPPQGEASLEMLAQCEHNRWCAEKLLDNWVPSKVRDNSLKHHPNLVPWNLDTRPQDYKEFVGFSPLADSDKTIDRDIVSIMPDYLEALSR